MNKCIQKLLWSIILLLCLHQQVIPSSTDSLVTYQQPVARPSYKPLEPSLKPTVKSTDIPLQVPTRHPEKNQPSTQLAPQEETFTAPKTYWQSLQSSIQNSVQSVAQKAFQAKEQFNNTINFIFDQDSIVDAYAQGQDFPEDVDYDKIGKGLLQDAKEYPNKMLNETLQSAAAQVTKIAEDLALQKDSLPSKQETTESSSLFSIEPDTAAAFTKAKNTLVDAGIIVSTKAVSNSLNPQESNALVKQKTSFDQPLIEKEQPASPLAQAKEDAYVELKKSVNHVAQKQIKNLSTQIEEINPRALIASNKQPADTPEQTSFFDAQTVDALIELTDTAKNKLGQTIQVAKEVTYKKAVSGIQDTAITTINSFISPLKAAQEYLFAPTSFALKPTFTAIDKNTTQRNFYDSRGNLTRTVLKTEMLDGTTTYTDKNARGETEKITELFKDKSGTITTYKEGNPLTKQFFDMQGKLTRTISLENDIYDSQGNLFELD